ncbi:Uncharacterised protein [Bordetella pertussis]|nr:Uncharacterised protein [Bordetella pertussis]CFP64742.1 Uncharacterised protein [Bordetella pertussis]
MASATQARNNTCCRMLMIQRPARAMRAAASSRPA